MLILIPFALLAGIVTMLSPCVFPLLPVILTESTTAGRRRPFGVITGFVLFFCLATLSIGVLMQMSSIPLDIGRYIAVGILSVMGSVLLLRGILPGFLSALRVPVAPIKKIGAKPVRIAQSAAGGFWAGVPSGAALGILWTPCVGPILAGVISLAAAGGFSWTAVAVTLAFAAGTALPMLAIMYAGKTFQNRINLLKRHSRHIQRAFGAVMIMVAVGVAFGIDRRIQAAVLRHLPQYEQYLTSFENRPEVEQEVRRLLDTSPESE